MADSEVFRLIGDATLRIEPSAPFASRDVSFTLDSLEPWQMVTVQFVDPRGQPAEWITASEANLIDPDGSSATQQNLYSGESGRVAWLRIATKDGEEDWSVRITVDEQTASVSYRVSQLQLPGGLVETVGVELWKHEGPVSDTFYSALVPGALVVDLQEHLGLVKDQLDRRLAVQGLQVPVVYMAGDESAFQRIAEATGTEAGPVDGYFLTDDTRSGIYMRADFLRTRVQRVLTHEYVHSVLYQIAGDRALPAWLNEGIAKYYEYVLGVQGERPDAARAGLYRSADLARDAALTGTLLSLSSLENQKAWNSQKDKARISLQYAQSHMAMRYLTDTYGAGVPIGIVKRMAGGPSLPEALQDEIGVDYHEFERQFVQWLKTWEDPERREIRQGIQALNGVVASVNSLFGRRTEDLKSGAPPAHRVLTAESRVSDAEQLLGQLEDMSPPAKLEPLHQEGLTFVNRVAQWMTLELEHLRDQEYLGVLDGIITSVGSITARRAEDIASRAPVAQRIRTKQALVADVEALLKQLGDVTPPTNREALHQQGLTFLNRLVQWLTLELESFESNDAAKQKQANDMLPEINTRSNLLVDAIAAECKERSKLTQANAMLPEINGRETIWRRGIGNVEAVYHLLEPEEGGSSN